MLTTGQLATWQVGVISHPPRAIRQSASQTIGPDRQMVKWPIRPTIGRCGHGRYRHKTKSATWLTHSTLAETIPSAGRVAIPPPFQAICEPIDSQLPPPNGQVQFGPPSGDAVTAGAEPTQVGHLAVLGDTRGHRFTRPTQSPNPPFCRTFPGRRSRWLRSPNGQVANSSGRTPLATPERTADRKGSHCRFRRPVS